ncbi:MAG TPA: hypothetical protein VIG88_13255 [Lysobacter sp.]
MDRHLSCVIPALLAFAALPAGAQTVQKCVSPDGQARYQSAPCQAHERVAGIWDAVPDARVATAPATRAAAHLPAVARTRMPRRHAARPTRASPPDACAQARRERDEGERRAGLKRTYALLSSLQARVFEACR